MHCGDLNGKEVQKAEDICIRVADSFHCTGETVQEEKGTTEDEMLGWHHRLDGHEFER